MAKKINEKITNTHQLSVEANFNLDNLPDEVFMAEVEDEGNIDVGKLLREKFNGEYAKLNFTVKTEQSPEE